MDERGLRESTLIIFTSDHGVTLYDHGFHHKHHFYDEAWRVPLIVSQPGHLANGAFTLSQPLRVEIAPNSWSGPVSNGRSTITFKQAIGLTDAVRTGAYSRTLTFTLSTTAP